MRRYYKKGGTVKMGIGGLLKPKLTLKTNDSDSGGLIENPLKPLKAFKDSNPITAMSRVAKNDGSTMDYLKAGLDPKNVVFRNNTTNTRPRNFKEEEEKKKKKGRM